MWKYQQISKNILCPVCHTNGAHILWETNSKQAAQHFVLKEKEPEKYNKLATHIEHLWGQDICHVVECDNCGFCYSYPFIAGDERFYTLAYDRTGYPVWKWEFQMTYNALNDPQNSEKKLLELGAGDGAFIKRISEKILAKENILCTEFSEYGKHHIEAIGVKCLTEDVRNISNKEFEGNFDVICMFQVLEHLDKLTILFEKLNWLMKQKGSLFIAVPNPVRIQFNELNGALLDMPPNHVGRWNKKCFEEIGNQYGFYIEDHKVENSNFISMAKEFVIYRFYQRSQKSGTIDNYIQRIKNRYLLRILQVGSIAVTSIMTIPNLIKLNSGMGSSQWIHLIKK